MNTYLIGLATLPALAAALLILWILAGIGRKAWSLVDEAVIRKVELARNKVRVFEQDDNPEYLTSANVLRDALLASPKLYAVRGFGWVLIAVRNTRQPKGE